MNAKEARNIASKVHINEVSAQLSTVNTQIERHAEMGKFSVELKYLFEETINLLEEEGYTVKKLYVDNDRYDVYEISW